VVNNVVLYNVLVDVDNEDGQLMSGMSAQVFFVLGEAKHVPVIPVIALGKRLSDQDNEKGRAYQVKKIAEDNQVREKVIHVGLQTRRFAEIREGLAIGDRVKLTVAAARKNGSRDSSRPPSVPRI
jgi:macrolide-specific efflux system membrane fusion protein